MLEFPPGDWHKVAGRGNIYVTVMPCDYDDQFLNTEVKIEGHTYTVRGVETFRNSNQKVKYHEGQVMGILVRGDIQK